MRLLRTLAVFLGALTLPQAACTAWQYDIENCDPNLGLAACQRLNVAEGIDITQDCASIWQCNNLTFTCEKTIKDLDRDGDVSVKCGGTDCNDNDAHYSGLAQTCGCNLAGQPCRAGKGACTVDLTTECRNSALFCPEQNVPAPRDLGWHREPYSAGSVVSWDWDCDGSGDAASNAEKNCAADINGLSQPCVPTACSDSVLARINGSTDYKRDNQAICQEYCHAQISNPQVCKWVQNVDNVIDCLDTCGAPIFKCRCQMYCADVACKSQTCDIAYNLAGPIVSQWLISCR